MARPLHRGHSAGVTSRLCAKSKNSRRVNKRSQILPWDITISDCIVHERIGSSENGRPTPPASSWSVTATTGRNTPTRLQRIEDPGNWELTLPAKALKHGQLYKLHVYWEGGFGERIPSYANRVVQDEATRYFRLKFGPLPNLSLQERKL